MWLILFHDSNINGPFCFCYEKIRAARAWRHEIIRPPERIATIPGAKKVLATLILGATPHLRRAIYATCVENRDLRIYQVQDICPTPYELTQLLSRFAPEILFLEIGSRKAVAVASHTRTVQPNTAIIGFADNCDNEQLSEAREAGVMEVLVAPFTADELQRTLDRVAEGQRSETPENLFAFVPAKAGSGCSTVAVNVAGALACDCRQKVLVIDADLHSGLVGPLLSVDSERSILDALENSHQLDDKLWGRLVVKAHGLELLPAPERTNVGMLAWGGCQQLLAFVRPRYDTVIADLPDVVDSTGEGILKQAKAVYVVCTPEAPSLSLASRRITELQTQGVLSSRLRIVLNRYVKAEMTIEEAESVLKREVSFVVPNDYSCVRQAILDARLITGRSKLGRTFSSFARMLAADQSLPSPHREHNAGLQFLFRRFGLQRSS